MKLPILKSMANTVQLIALLALLSFFIASCEREADASKFNGKLLTKVEAKALSDEFRRTYESCDDKDTIQTYAWFSAEVLENYLLYANHLADSLHVNATGMRVYFGVYPNADGGNASFNERAGKLTVFFSPTARRESAPESTLSDGDEGDILLDGRSYLLNFGNMGYPPKIYNQDGQ